MYQVKIDNSNKSAVFGKKIGAENSAPILCIPKELLETHS